MIKKIFLLLVMCIYMTSINALTYQDSNGVTWTFSVITYGDHTGASLTGMSGYSSNVEVPRKVSDGTNEYDVLWLGNPAITYGSSGPFYNKTTVTSVVLPESLLGLGSSTFYNCTSLQSVNIPQAITDIPSSAFNNCI